MAFRFVAPTWRNYIKYVDMEARDSSSDNADARRYVAAWRSLPHKERLSHWPEQLCDLTNVPPCDLISWVTRQFWIEGSAQASMCLAFMRDKVLEKVGQFAMEDAANLGHAKLFMGAAGLLPSTGGGRASPPVNQFFNLNPSASASSVSAAGAKSSNVPVGTLRDMDDQIIEISEIMQTGSTDVAATRVPDAPEEEDDDDDDDKDED